MTKLVVLGGSGFVGKAICREAIRRGWQVTSLSRHGAPPQLATDSLLQKVIWYQESALNPSVYPSLLKDQDYLVHSIGILFESRSNDSSQPIPYERTYRALIRDTTELAVKEALTAGLKGLAFISAASFGSLGGMLLPEYTKMKQEAEQLLIDTSQSQQKINLVLVRPSGIYGKDRWLTIPISWMSWMVSLFTAGLIPRMVSVEAVARTIIDALTRDKPLQIIENNEVA